MPINPKGSPEESMTNERRDLQKSTVVKSSAVSLGLRAMRIAEATT
jgi:hypothetical protein